MSVIKNGKLNVNIDIQATLKRIKFNITNTCADFQNYNEGIGLENIKKRLEMLYPNQYDLDISYDNDQFNVVLVLQLKSSLPNA